jgi:alpha-beta hydrolase superfamily lysophospholipase
MKGYENDTVWKKVQEFLPEENRLNADNLPKEEWMKFDEKIIHVDYYSAAEEKGVVIIYHGVGGNGRLLSFIAQPLCNAGFDVVCPDLPLYGYTVCNGKINYAEWVDCGTFVAEKYRKENKPLYLFGLSAGGMLAYQISCRLKNVSGLIATCLLDQRINKVTRETASSPIAAVLGKPFLKIAHLFAGTIKLPMKIVCNMKAIVNNRDLAKLLMKDSKSSGAKVSLGFLHGMLNPDIEIEPENYRKCPVLLVHTEKDYWTDVSLSRLFFDRIQAAKEIKLLQGAGHFPIESLGLKQLEEYCIEFMTSK